MFNNRPQPLRTVEKAYGSLAVSNPKGRDCDGLKK